MGRGDGATGPLWDPPCPNSGGSTWSTEELAATTRTRQLPGNQEGNLHEETTAPKSPPPAPQHPHYPRNPCHSLGAQGCWPSWGRAVGHRRWLRGLGTVGGEEHRKVRASPPGHQLPWEAALCSPLALGGPRGLWAPLPLCGLGVLAGPRGWDRGSRVSGCTVWGRRHQQGHYHRPPPNPYTPCAHRKRPTARVVPPIKDPGSHPKQEELKAGARAPHAACPLLEAFLPLW